MTSQTATPARREREALCDLFTAVGPDAPTLCGDWTTRDLAAHLIIRERRPDAAAGILISKLAGHTEKVQAAVAAGAWHDMVAKVRIGPPKLSPTRIEAIERATNTIEFFVHHEDVRRAGDTWEARELDLELRDDLRKSLARGAKMMTRKLTVGLTLAPNDTTDLEPIVAKDGAPTVTVSGPIGEIVLFMYGRAQTLVELSGDEVAVATIRNTSFGL